MAAKARQRLGGQEQLLQRVDAQHAGARDRGVEDQVRSGQRAGVRARRRLAGARAAGLDQDHRLVARRRACGRHELARRADRLDVHQDRTRARIGGEVVEQVAEVDVGALAERGEVREADAARAGPVEQRGHQRARLGQEGDVAGGRTDMREARVEPQVRRDQPDAVGAQHAQQVRPGRIEHGLLLRGVEAGGDDHRGARAARAELGDEPRHAGRRGADHGQLGRVRQVGHARNHRLAVERGQARVDRVQRAAEVPVQVAPDGGADAAGAVARADHGHRGGVEERVKVADAHRGQSGYGKTPIFAAASFITMSAAPGMVQPGAAAGLTSIKPRRPPSRSGPGQPTDLTCDKHAACRGSLRSGTAGTGATGDPRHEP